jgi:lysophospholipase L1-like esterase
MKSVSKILFIHALLLGWCPLVAQTGSALPGDTSLITDLTLDSLTKVRTVRPISGSSRRGDNPVLFLIGNSTMRTGTLGNGENGQWGCGYFMQEYFNEDSLTVENHALGGTSSRTFYNRCWSEVKKGIRAGDWLIIEFGHNDSGSYDSGRARASIPGIGMDSLEVTIQETGTHETVYTYGEYLRRFIRESRSLGAFPILFSPTPRNAWDNADSTILSRSNATFGLWSRQVADAENIPFVDLNEITARKYETFGKEKVKYMFYLDRVHTNVFGARVNAESAIEGIRDHPDLARYLKPEPCDAITGSSRKLNRPVVFLVGDSSVKNHDSDPDGMWGWGSVISDLLSTDISVENCAIAGRSARTYLNEGHWDKIYHALRAGDFVLIQFGLNDGGDIHTGKARGDLPGSGDESQVFLIEMTARYEVVYTFGWYLCKFIMDAQEKGAIPVILSHTPRNRRYNGLIERNTETYGRWAREAAEAKGAYFIDLNKRSADKLQAISETEAAAFFCQDHTHTSLKGAKMNAESIVEGLKSSECPLKNYLK